MRLSSKCASNSTRAGGNATGGRLDGVEWKDVERMFREGRSLAGGTCAIKENWEGPQTVKRTSPENVKTGLHSLLRDPQRVVGWICFEEGGWKKDREDERK